VACTASRSDRHHHRMAGGLLGGRQPRDEARSRAPAQRVGLLYRRHLQWCRGHEGSSKRPSLMWPQFRSGSLPGPMQTDGTMSVMRRSVREALVWVSAAWSHCLVALGLVFWLRNFTQSPEQLDHQRATFADAAGLADRSPVFLPAAPGGQRPKGIETTSQAVLAELRSVIPILQFWPGRPWPGRDGSLLGRRCPGGPDQAQGAYPLPKTLPCPWQ